MSDHDPARRLGLAVAVVLAGAALVLSVLAATAPFASAAAKGIVDSRLEVHGGIDLGQVDSYAEEMGPANLGAKWTRVFAYWDELQPDEYGPFNQDYIDELDTVVSALHAQGINVILTGSDPPDWARDYRYEKYWSKNKTTAVVNIGDPKVAADFQSYARFLADHFKAPQYGVTHFEVWNEPNLRLIPQIVMNKKAKQVVGPAVYCKMLVDFSKGAHAGNPNACVIAGATSRMGSPGTTAGSTSPQWFARYIKAHVALKWFQAYSHHPYTTRASAPQPSAMPRRPDISVTLGNLSTLLKIFPTKPFYLTEFCYSTSPHDAFVLAVSKADQALYLRQAYQYLDQPRFHQVKVLLWFLVQDWQSVPGDPSSVGVYTGLIDSNGVRKPAWWAFAGGNKITIASPLQARAGAAFSVSGTVTTRQGPLADGQVILQKRGLTAKTWVKAGTGQTDAEGDYQFAVYQSKAMRYRVIWNGVQESSSVTVGLAQ